MDFSDITDKVRENAQKYMKNHDITITEDFCALKLQEETGEFIQALLIKQHNCRAVKRISPDKATHELGKELADVVGLAIMNAKIHNIDLEQYVKDKRFDTEK